MVVMDYPDVAERIFEDKRSLEVTFRGRPKCQIEIRSIIKIVEREWFNGIWIDESRKHRPMKYSLSEKGTAKLAKLNPRSY